jgi:hypothetical protein
MTLWCLWEPPEQMPGYVRACLRTIERNAGLEVRLLSAHDVAVICPAMRQELAARAPTLAQQADYYRAHILAQHGGLWLDLDTVVMQSLRPLVEGLNHYEVVARRNRLQQLSVSVLAMRPEGAARRWVALQEQILEGPESPAWTALGSEALTRACEGATVQLIPPADVAPLDWTEAELFASRWAPTALALKDRPSAVNLYHSRLPAVVKEASEEEALASTLLVGRLLRAALSDGEPATGAAAERAAPIIRFFHRHWRRARQHLRLRR